MVNNFADNFWDADWDGTEGYDALVTKLKDGKKLYDAFNELIRARAKVEDEYGRKLIHLAQTTGEVEETGTLGLAWDSVKKETENIGLVHCDLSKHLTDIAEKSERFRGIQKQDRHKIDDALRKQQKDKKICHENVIKAKKLYEQRCRDADLASETYENKSSYTPKEEDKLKRHQQKCKTAAEGADVAYLNLVKQLEELRKKYIVSMEDACTKYQTMEEKRIQFLRHEMWAYTNLGSGHLINEGEKYELCRKVIEKCDDKLDVQIFINMNSTGNTRPLPIEYENYYHKQTSNSTTQPQQKSDVSKSSSPTDLRKISPHDKRPPRPSNLPSNNTNHHTQDNKRNSLGSSDISNTLSQVEESDNTYSTILDLKNPKEKEIKIPKSSTKVAKAAFAYQSQSEQELSLKPGDVIEVRNIVDDTWGIGTLNGKLGAFPLAFVDISKNS